MFHFPRFPFIQTPAFAVNYYSHGSLSFFVVQCFKIMLGGKLGDEARVCIGINGWVFLSSSTEGSFKSNCYLVTILRRFSFFSSFSATLAYSL